MNRSIYWLIVILLFSCFTLSATKETCPLHSYGRREGKMEKIYLLTIGEVDKKLLTSILSELSKRFGCPCEVTDSGMKLPQEAYSFRREQYWSSEILQAVKKKGLPTDAKRVLAVVDVDLYVPQLNFVFGEAELGGKAAIISLKRLRPQFYREPPDNDLFKKRVLKEAIHELGHTFGLRHCLNVLCIMHFSNSIADTDKKQPEFCPQCKKKLENQLKVP